MKRHEMDKKKADYVTGVSTKAITSNYIVPGGQSTVTNNTQRLQSNSLTADNQLLTKSDQHESPYAT